MHAKESFIATSPPNKEIDNGNHLDACCVLHDMQKQDCGNHRSAPLPFVHNIQAVVSGDSTEEFLTAQLSYVDQLYPVQAISLCCSCN